MYYLFAAAQQQSSQKTTTAIAAVEPFEHKPPGSNYPSENRVPTPTKDQEIDIKLIERNGGSGQSSPSFSGELNFSYSFLTGCTF